MPLGAVSAGKNSMRTAATSVALLLGIVLAAGESRRVLASDNTSLDALLRSSDFDKIGRGGLRLSSLTLIYSMSFRESCVCLISLICTEAFHVSPTAYQVLFHLHRHQTDCCCPQNGTMKCVLLLRLLLH